MQVVPVKGKRRGAQSDCFVADSSFQWCADKMCFVSIEKCKQSAYEKRVPRCFVCLQLEFSF